MRPPHRLPWLPAPAGPSIGRGASVRPQPRPASGQQRSRAFTDTTTHSRLATTIVEPLIVCCCISVTAATLTQTAASVLSDSLWMVIEMLAVTSGAASPPSARRPPGAPARGGPRPTADIATLGETRPLQPLAGPNTSILCQQLNEADGGCFGCTLPAYHTGQHSIYSKGRTRHSKDFDLTLSDTSSQPEFSQLTSMLCAEASKAVEHAASSREAGEGVVRGGG